jgi:pyrimidine operon attenuation protein/uracil phosphoribosyltransferase
MNRIMDEEDIKRALRRISHEILERNRGTKGLALIGVQSRGVNLASRIKSNIQQIENVDIPQGALDITFYRDDVNSRLSAPEIKETDVKFDTTDMNVVIVDDVLFTGRTVRAAIEAIMDFGRPNTILLACLVDRGHRELPISADFVGKNIPTSIKEEVSVKVKEVDGVDEVTVSRKE